MIGFIHGFPWLHQLPLEVNYHSSLSRRLLSCAMKNKIITRWSSPLKLTGATWGWAFSIVAQQHCMKAKGELMLLNNKLYLYIRIHYSFSFCDLVKAFTIYRRRDFVCTLMKSLYSLTLTSSFTNLFFSDVTFQLWLSKSVGARV